MEENQSLTVTRKSLKRKNSDEDYTVEEPDEVLVRDWNSYSDVRDTLMKQLDKPKADIKETHLNLIDELYSKPHGQCRFSQPWIFAGPHAYRRVQKKIVYIDKPSKMLTINA